MLGDFYIFYTYDSNNKPSQPRIAIQMNGSQIGQIRGILQHQELEPIMAPILEQKLKEFGPEADQYKKKVEDMRKMTEIENKNKSGTPLNKEDLIFLYEINSKIEGFGYDKDPRIEEIRKTRDPKKDAPIVLNCESNQIATNEREISQNTKAYIGSLSPNIFSRNIENIYTSFPEGKIQKYETQIGGQIKNEFVKKMEAQNIKISNYAQDMLNNPDFKTQPNIENLNLVRLTVKDLGFSNYATTEQIYQRADELGLDLCPAEVGPHLRLSYSGIDWMFIAMKQISDRDGSARVFDLSHDDADLWLDGSAHVQDGWAPGGQFVFCSRKS